MIAQQPSQPQIDAETAPLNGMSHVRGEQRSSLDLATIPEMLKRTVSVHGDRDAFVFSQHGVRKTYAEFDEEVDGIAAGFLSLGLQKGDRVGIWSPNRYEWVLTQFATARAGLILVCINPAYRVGELEYALNKVSCKALVLAPRFKDSHYINMIVELAPELSDSDKGPLKAQKLPHLEHVILMEEEPPSGVIRFQDLICDISPDQRETLDAIELDPNDAINIQFTSGTTGAPKGATLTHSNIVNNGRFVTDRILMSAQDRLCIPVPLYHCFGMVMGVLGAAGKGSAMIFPSEGFEPARTLRSLSDERCSAVYGVPTMFIAMLEEMDAAEYDVSSLKTGIMAGAPCPVDVMERVTKQMNLRDITIGYGMTETSPVSFQSFVDDPTDKRCSTVGRIHPHLEVKIIDEKGNTVPVNTQGELCTKGYSVMKGYWEDLEKTTESIIDGWMHSGDLAVLDEKGFCSIVGRVKDMIIRGGENIYPREIEEFLFLRPEISQVQLFGIPDPKYGETVCAFVIPASGVSLSEDQVKAFCKGHIAHYKIPHHVRIVKEIPMTITGKPQKFVMRDQMVEMLAIEANEGTKAKSTGTSSS